MAKKKEFEDTLEATEFMDTLHDMLNDPRLADWAEVTDINWGQSSESALKDTIRAYDNFTNEMDCSG